MQCHNKSSAEKCTFKKIRGKTRPSRRNNHNERKVRGGAEHDYVEPIKKNKKKTKEGEITEEERNRDRREKTDEENGGARYLRLYHYILCE